MFNGISVFYKLFLSIRIADVVVYYAAPFCMMITGALFENFLLYYRDKCGILYAVSARHFRNIRYLSADSSVINALL